MPKLNASYKTKEDIPTGAEEFYEERDGEFHLSIGEGFAAKGDVDRTQKALRAERQAHKETKDRLAKFGDLDADGVREKLDHVEELEAEVAGLKKEKPDSSEIDRLVDAKVKRIVAPIERERDQLKAKVGTLEQENGSLSGTIKSGRIETQLRKAAETLKVVGPAIDDVVAIGLGAFEIDDAGNVVTRDAAGLTPGLDAAAWLKDQQDKRPHWWAASVGGGAGGHRFLPQGVQNPWAGKSWNLTRQGELLRTLGREKCDQLAQQAGTTVGGSKPEQKAA